MTTPPSPLRYLPRAGPAVVAAHVVLAAPEQEPGTKVTLARFQNQVNDYLALRWHATRDLPPLPSAARLPEIIAAIVEQQVRAVRRARDDARTGEIFASDVAFLIRQNLSATIDEHAIDVARLLEEVACDAPKFLGRPRPKRSTAVAACCADAGGPAARAARAAGTSCSIGSSSATSCCSTSISDWWWTCFRRHSRNRIRPGDMPFTPEEFFGVFREYNLAFWPLVAIACLAAAWIAAAVLRRGPGGGDA